MASSTSSADDSLLSMEGFEVLPDTPASMRGVQFEDFTEASPLHQHYCQAMLSEAEYEKQACSETEKALMELIAHLENDPTIYMKLLRKRKKEELEERSFASYLKSKLLQKWKGKQYVKDIVTQDECEEKLCEVKTGMLMAFNYAKETKSRRFSKRLQEKQARQAHSSENQAPSTAMAPPPPPPPLPPPPAGPPSIVYTPLREISNIKPLTPANLTRPPLHATKKAVERSDSLRGIHEELKSSNPLKRLRATETARSPGGTPLMKRRSVDSTLGTPDALNTSESLSGALLRILEAKFKNVRSPSPAPRTPKTPGSFINSPQQGFTP